MCISFGSSLLHCLPLVNLGCLTSTFSNIFACMLNFLCFRQSDEFEAAGLLDFSGRRLCVSYIRCALSFTSNRWIGRSRSLNTPLCTFSAFLEPKRVWGRHPGFNFQLCFDECRQRYSGNERPQTISTLLSWVEAIRGKWTDLLTAVCC